MINAEDLRNGVGVPSMGEIDYYRLRERAKNFLEDIPHFEQKIKEHASQGHSEIFFRIDQIYDINICKRFFESLGYEFLLLKDYWCVRISWR